MTPHYADEVVTIYEGDARAVLAELEAESVQTVVTSPPYFGLRDYGIPPTAWGGDPGHAHDWSIEFTAAKESNGSNKARWQHSVNGDGLTYETDWARGIAPPLGRSCLCGAWCGVLGLEPAPDLYVEHMVEVFRAVRRVLRADGTVWLNLGDTYADRANKRSDGESYRADRADVVPAKKHTIGGAWALKAKDRMMIPARVALALQADGWWLRDEIVWAKPNPMPSSVDDRTTPAHEMVYLLTKAGRYYYDQAAIAEPATHADEAKYDPGTNGHEASVSHRGSGASTRRFKHPAGWNDGATADDHLGRYPAKVWPGIGTETAAARAGARGRAITDLRGPINAPLTRNKRSVWTVPTAPYPDAHFATFPPKLIEPMILAGAAAGSVVLDPFGGSGTVGMVARATGRRAVLIDLNPEYLRQAIVRSSHGMADPGGAFAADGLWAAAQ